MNLNARKNRTIALVATTLALFTAGLAAAVGGTPTVNTYTYTTAGTTVVVPPSTYTQSVTVPTVTETTTSTVTTTVTQTVTAPSGPTAVWNGDFETGDFSQYDGGLQQFAPGRSTVVSTSSSLGGPSGPRTGTKFSQYLVKSGDNVLGGERAEALKGNLGVANGADQWYSWSFSLPSSFPVSANGQTRSILIGQFHSDSNATFQGQANIQFGVTPNLAGANFGHTATSPGFFVGVNGGDPNQNGQYLNINTPTGGLNGHPYTSYAFDLGALAPYQGGVWTDWVMHVVWSDSGTGLVDVYRRLSGESSFTKVVSFPNCSNLYRGYSAYLKVGMNRTQSSGMADGYVWFDDFKLLSGSPL